MNNASVTWVEGMQFAGELGSGHQVILDADAASGGHNAGPRPMEMLLLGVLGCTGMDVISILKKKRQNVTGLKITATGERAEDQPHYYTRIALDYVAYGDVDEEALRRSIELSETKYCPAISTLNGKTEFSTTYHVEKAAASVEPAVTE